MRIALLSPPWIPVPPSGYGGIEWIVSLLAEELVARGHDVTLFATGDSKTSADLRYVFEVGPAVAMECHEGGGAHIDRLEWDVQEDGGEIVLSSRLARASRFEAYHTGVHARIESKPCACGNPDPRLIFE